MSLPSTFANSGEYFDAALSFLSSHAWIYEHANTRFISEGAIDRFPPEYADFFLKINNEDLNRFPFVYETELSVELPESLKEFRQKLRTLIPASVFETVLPDPDNSDAASGYFHRISPGPICLTKMKLKKQHEITQLAEVIIRHCSETRLLLDFGSGLGYLSEMLYACSTKKYLILGLEADSERVAKAERRRQKHLAEEADSIVYKQEFITDASLTLIDTASRELALSHGIQTPEMAIVGLHACADLTVTAMKIFFQRNAVRQLIIMPCCYHKLQMSEPGTNSTDSSTSGDFPNFPVSEALKKALTTAPCHFLNRPFLRLACQQTTARWRDSTPLEHATHGKEMFMRAVAEAILDEESEKVVKQKSKSNDDAEDSQVDLSDLSYVELCSQYVVRSKVTNARLKWRSRHKANFNDFMCPYILTGPKLAEALTCLQTAMQKLCENIVLYDRLCFMQEQAAEKRLEINVRFQKILNEKLSPRCYVLIAEKLSDSPDAPNNAGP